ncbi:MAG: hypothetical protein Tsb0019_32040 [Roseibium sp.]
MPSMTRHTLLTSGRRWTFRILAGLLSVVALGLLASAPITVMDDNWSMIGISIVVAEIAALFGGLAWLGWLLLAPER